jgi:hypothetical protein
MWVSSVLQNSPIRRSSLVPGSVTVICMSSVSVHTGRLHSKLVAWFQPQSGHSGPEVAKNVLCTLETQGARKSVLRARLSLVGGDGAVVSGGPDRKNMGTGAAEILWREVHPTSEAGDDEELLDHGLPVKTRIRTKTADDSRLHFCTEWDKYHREDIGLLRAVKRSPMASELYDLCAILDAMFHMGDGKQLLRAAATSLGVQSRSGSLPAPTRKAVGSGGEPGNLLANFTLYAAGLHAREQWRQQGHTSYGGRDLVDVGRRLTNLAFVAFATVYRDAFRFAVTPWCLSIQSDSMEPWVLHKRKVKHEVASALV